MIQVGAAQAERSPVAHRQQAPSALAAAPLFESRDNDELELRVDPAFLASHRGHSAEHPGAQGQPQ